MVIHYAGREHRERCVIAASLVTTSLLGCGYLLWNWMSKGQPVDGVLRSITFVCAMVAVHAWGYAMYRRQGHSMPERCAAGTSSRVHWTVVLAQQAIALMLTLTILDGGTLLRLCLASIGTFWVSAGVIVLSRRRGMTRVDAALLTGGFWLLFATISFAAHLVWWLKGL